MTHPFDALSLDDLHERRSEKWRAYPRDVLPTFVAEMDFPVAEPVRAAVHAAVEASDLGYPAEDAHVRLGEALAAYAADTWGWPVDPGRAMVLPDVMRGVQLCLTAFTAPGDGVVVNTPIYPPFLHVVRDTDRALVESPVAWRDGRPGLDLDALEERFAAGARAYLLCNPHNPSGYVARRAELERIVALAERYGVLVVTDEIHAPLTYPGVPFTPLLSLPAAGDVAVCVTSTSKAWNLPGLKAAVLVAGNEERQKALLDLPFLDRWGESILGVEASVAAWTEGREWLTDTVAYLDGNRTELARLVSAELPGVRYALPEGTYLGWLDLRELGLSDPAATLLDRGRVAVGDGAEFGPPGVGWVRVNFATSRAILAETVRRIATALR